ncbi:MAG: hypothetical protein HKN95_10725 [Acidimicrobiia bacterium]|nr:hypothetical protein [Acidimicrobiia bacterium]
MADSRSDMLARAEGAGTTSEAGASTPSVEPRPEEPVGRSAAFDALVEDIRRVYGSSFDLLPRLEELIRRRLGVAPQSPGAVIMAGLTGPGIRLLVAFLATVLFGQWTEIPWGRWAAILVFSGFFEGGNMAMSAPPNAPPPPRIKRILEDWTALLPTIVRESDLRDLADFTRRWYRLPAVVAAGVAVAAIMLMACVLFTPAALSELQAGTIVLLAWLLYDFGATPVYWGNIVQRAFMAREARYDHQLFWPSPADSPEVHKVMRKTTIQGFIAGGWITVFLVLTVVLVSWDSALVLPLAVGFVVIGYLSTFGLAFSNRASVRRIIERSRNQRLAVLRHRIDTFESRFADLSPEESEHLRDLLFLHDKIRDAPKTPDTARTLARTAAALILPTLMFVVTVFGEVSAERFLDAIVP